MRILITGAAGFIGSYLAQKLEQHDLILVDDYSALDDGRPKLYEIGRHKIISADISNPDVCKELTYNTEIIYHLASISGIGKCQHCGSYQSNVVGTSYLAQYAEEHEVKKIIYASTSAVYGESQAYSITETHRVKPRTRYGWQKYAGEIIFQSTKIPTVIIRKSNVYGHALFHKQTAVDNFIDKALSCKDITINGKGSQRRDYVHIDDVVSMYLNSLYWDSGVYNIGGLDNLSIEELANLVIETTGSKSKKIYNESGETGSAMKNFVYNWQRAKERGYFPKNRVKDEIQRRISGNNNKP
jgi:UDP-glucose 4-epimerase